MEKKKKQINQKQLKGGNKNQKPLKNSNNNNNNKIKNKPMPSKQKNTPEERLSDLENTLEINIQILKTFSQSSKPVQTLLTNQSSLLDEIDNIKKKYLIKKNLFNQLKERKSKSLIELQIYAEKKRKIEEMKDLYQDKIQENEEGLNGKEEVIKKVQKRLKEVEIYIHKLTLNMPDKKRQKYYQDFLMNDFLDINNDLSRQKDLLIKKVEQIKNDFEVTVDENKLLKNKNKEEKVNNDNNNEIKNNDGKNENEEKLKKLTEKYENKIQLANSKINLLKNALEKMNEQFHLFNINKLAKKLSKSININIAKEEDTNKNVNYFKKVSISKKKNEGSSLKNQLDTEESFNKNNDDIDNRLNSFLDFSVLNNKEDDNNISKDKFGLIKSSIWDVSAINAKDISFIEKKDGF